MNTFGDRLRSLRVEKGLTQEELASKFDMHKTRISQYELSKRQTDDETKKIFADFFNVSLDYLMGFTDIREPADKIIKKHQDELSTPESYKSKYKITKQDTEHYEDFIENAHTFFMDDSVAEEDLEKIYKDISELFWEAKDMKKKKK